MPDGHLLALFIPAVVVLCLTPGPDMLFVVANTLRQGTRAGLLSALGISMAMLVHTTATSLGLAYLFARSMVAFDVVRDVGAVYLIWLGIRALRHPVAFDAAQPEEVSTTALLRQGFLTNLLNPKVIVFFAAFLPQFVTPNTRDLIWPLVVLGVLFLLIGLCIDAGIAIASGAVRGMLVRSRAASRALGRLSGLVLIGLGMRLLVTQRSP